MQSTHMSQIGKSHEGYGQASATPACKTGKIRHACDSEKLNRNHCAPLR